VEALIHWVGPVAPPSPGTNIDTQDSMFVAAGDRSVLVAWDNSGELTADPIQKRILFTGYKSGASRGGTARWDRPARPPATGSS